MANGNQLAYYIYPYHVGLPTNVSTLGDVIGLLLPAIVALAGLACFLLILFGGFRYLTSGGDEKAVADAMKMMTNAVIGLAIVFGSWWAIRIIETILGISITK